MKVDLSTFDIYELIDTLNVALSSLDIVKKNPKNPEWLVKMMSEHIEEIEKLQTLIINTQRKEVSYMK